jgi:hypothetical protein
MQKGVLFWVKKQSLIGNCDGISMLALCENDPTE